MLARLLTVLVVLSAVFGFQARAETLIAGLSDKDYPPFYFVEGGRMRGAAVEIAQAVAGSLGHDLRFERFPWGRIQRNLGTGRIDTLILYFKTPERERDAVYTDISHIRESSSLFVRAEDDLRFDGDHRSLAGKRFGNVRGYSHGKAYDHDETLRKFNAGDEEALIRLVVHRRIDIGVGNKPAILFHAQRLGLVDRIRFLDPVVDDAPNYFAFSRKRPDAADLARSFSDAVRAFMATEDYARTLQRYGFRPPELP